jgi:hypothetical protein
MSIDSLGLAPDRLRAIADESSIEPTPRQPVAGTTPKGSR